MKQLAPLFAVLILIAGSVHADTRLAVLGTNGQEVDKLLPLVELRLGKKADVTLLERENLKEVLREQKLNALCAAEGATDRVALGKLLKADVLVLLQGGQSEPPPPLTSAAPRDTPPFGLEPGSAKPAAKQGLSPYVRVVVCETRHGLRLCNVQIEVSKDIEADVDAVVHEADKAIDKQRRPLIDIVAVPPFVNDTLAYEGDYLRAASARLIEELLVDQPGVVLVELSEARAVARELTIAGGETIERRLPLYVLGEYRLERAGENRKVSFKLTLERGSTRIDARQDVAGSLEAFPAALRQAAGAMCSKALGHATRPPDPKLESEQLAGRARRLTRLGNWDEALALTEAALLLRPDRADLHGDALMLISILAAQQRLAQSRQAGPRGLLQEAAIELHRRWWEPVLYHAESYLANSTLKKDHRTDWLPGGPVVDLWNALGQSPDRESFRRGMVECRDEIEAAQAMCRRVLAGKAAAHVQDQAVSLLFPYLEDPIPATGYGLGGSPLRQAYLTEHIDEICAARLKLLEDFRYLDQQYAPWQLLEIHGRNSIRLCDEAAYVEFLKKARRLPNPGIGNCAKRTLARWQRFNRDAKVNHPPKAEPELLPQPSKSHIVRDPEVVFHPLTVSGLTNDISLWLQAGEGLDIIFMGMEQNGTARKAHASQDRWKRPVPEGHVALMRNKGRLRVLPLKLEMSSAANAFNHTSRLGLRCDQPMNVCWDGRYVWAVNSGENGPLVVIDPRDEKIWKLDRQGGLPPSQLCAVTGLSPGKVCVAGYFGRLWSALATFEPKAGIKLDVFYEAKDVFNDRQLGASKQCPLGVAQPFTFFQALRASSDPAREPRQRVLLGRRFGPVAIDPQTRRVEAVSFPPDTGRFQPFQQDGALYAANNRGKLYRLGFPDFKQELVNSNFVDCTCAVHQGRVHAINSAGEYFTASELNGKLRRLRCEIPVKDPNGDRMLLTVSSHYGLLLLTPSGPYQVEMKIGQPDKP